ncbi:hypothetical protein OH807_20630 [Kitasatospora sp. NBC_01560]|uniref:hypothetical protein n=1 Tax=Kitasatospora sp. NBC_01560 TaxID=2975965 RepID=UPI0038708D17
MSVPAEAPADTPADAPVPADGPVPADAPASAEAPVPVEGAAPGRKKLPRALGVALATAGLLAVTATSAAVTVAVGRPDARPAVAAALPSAGPTVSASPTASPSPTPTATPTPVAPVAPVPKPVSTVKGTVSGAKHDGDLRFFLLPIPDGGESYGPSDGMTMTDSEVSELFGNQDGIMRILRSYGYKDAATRMYRTADGKAEVTVTLLHFGSGGQAGDFAKNYTMKLDPIDIDGDPNAHGYVHQPKQQAYTGSMTGISSQGDVQYTVDVDVKGSPDKALLSELMKRQREWLSSGG